MAQGTSGALSTSNQYVKYTISIIENWTSIESNVSNVTVNVRFYRTNSYTTYGTGTVYCAINGTTYSATVTPSQKITSSGIILFSKTLNIEHNSDGTKTLDTAAYISHNAPLSSNSQGYSLALSTIPRASGLTVGNGTLGTAQTITADRKSSSFTHTLTWTCGSYSGTICDKSSAASWSFTPELKLANGAPNGTSVYCTFNLTTFNGSTNVGSVSQAVWLTIPDSVKPTCSLTVDTNTKEYLSGQQTWSGYIQGVSIATVSITAAGAYGSTIKSYSSTMDGNTYTSQSFSAVPQHDGTVTITTTVTDSRSRTATVSKNITVLRYQPVTIDSCSVYRCDSDGTKNDRGEYAQIACSYSYTTGGHLSKFVSYYLSYKKSTDETYTSAGERTQNWVIPYYQTSNISTDTCTSQIFAADIDSIYNIKIQVKDAFTETSRSITLSTGFCLYHIPASGKGISFGAINNNDGFNIAMPAHFSKGLNYDIPVQTSGDCNTLTTSGEYYIGTSGTNKPGSGLNGWLTVQSYSTDYCHQVFTTYQGVTYERMMQEGTWGSWNGPLFTDFIIAQGTSGIWTYRKWSSGIAECWGYTSIGYANSYVLQQWIALPFTFPSVRCVTTALVDAGGNLSEALNRNCKVAGFDSMQVTISVHNSSGSFSSGTTLPVSVRMDGRWKL